MQAEAPGGRPISGRCHSICFTSCSSNSPCRRRRGRACPCPATRLAEYQGI